MQEDTVQKMEREYDELLFGTLRSVRYHRHRKGFLDGVQQLRALVTALEGTATVIAAFADLPAEWSGVLPTAATITALAGAHEIAFRTAQRARRHESLARDFVTLEQDLRRAGPKLNASALGHLQQRRIDIEAMEPPIYRVLDATCHDELITSLGRDRIHRTNVTGWQRLFRHFFDLAPHRIHKRCS